MKPDIRPDTGFKIGWISGNGKDLGCTGYPADRFPLYRFFFSRDILYHINLSKNMNLTDLACASIAGSIVLHGHGVESRLQSKKKKKIWLLLS